jgi:hypothetical protein
MASEDPKMSTQCVVGKRQHITLMIPQNLEVIRRLESGKSQNVVVY